MRSECRVASASRRECERARETARMDDDIQFLYQKEL